MNTQTQSVRGLNNGMKGLGVNSWYEHPPRLFGYIYQYGIQNHPVKVYLPTEIYITVTRGVRIKEAEVHNLRINGEDRNLNQSADRTLVSDQMLLQRIANKLIPAIFADPELKKHLTDRNKYIRPNYARYAAAYYNL